MKHLSPAAACRDQDVRAPAQPSAGPWKLLVRQGTALDTLARSWQTSLAKTSRSGGALLL